MKNNPLSTNSAYFNCLAFMLCLLISILCSSCNNHKNNNTPATLAGVDTTKLKLDTPTIMVGHLIPPQPDFTVQFISLQPGYIVPPQTNCTFTLAVKNIGKADYAGNILVGNNWVISRAVSGLKVGETKQVLLNFTPYGKNCRFSMSFAVDPGNVIKESNESNNVSSTIVFETTW